MSVFEHSFNSSYSSDRLTLICYWYHIVCSELMQCAIPIARPVYMVLHVILSVAAMYRCVLRSFNYYTIPVFALVLANCIVLVEMVMRSRLRYVFIIFIMLCLNLRIVNLILFPWCLIVISIFIARDFDSKWLLVTSIKMVVKLISTLSVDVSSRYLFKRQCLLCLSIVIGTLKFSTGKYFGLQKGFVLSDEWLCLLLSNRYCMALCIGYSINCLLSIARFVSACLYYCYLCEAMYYNVIKSVIVTYFCDLDAVYDCILKSAYIMLVVVLLLCLIFIMKECGEGLRLDEISLLLLLSRLYYYKNKICVRYLVVKNYCCSSHKCIGKFGVVYLCSVFQEVCNNELCLNEKVWYILIIFRCITLEATIKYTKCHIINDIIFLTMLRSRLNIRLSCCALYINGCESHGLFIIKIKPESQRC